MTRGTEIPTHDAQAILSILRQVLERSGPRAAVKGGLSQCFGLTYKKWDEQQWVFVQPETRTKAEALRALNHILHRQPGLRNRRWSAIQCNWMTSSEPHTDKNNDGDATILGVGGYKGGALAIQDRDGTIKWHDISDAWITADLTKYHWNAPYEGERATIIMFNTTGHDGATDPQRKDLQLAGFPIESGETTDRQGRDLDRGTPSRRAQRSHMEGEPRGKNRHRNSPTSRSRPKFKDMFASLRAARILDSIRTSQPQYIHRRDRFRHWHCLGFLTVGEDSIPTSVLKAVIPWKPNNYVENLTLPLKAFLHFFAGPDDVQAMAYVALEREPNVVPHLMELDILRTKKHDLVNNDHTYWQLYQHAAMGHVDATIGGPNCRTRAVSRITKPQPGAPQLCTRHGMEAWGMQWAWNDAKEYEKLWNDNVSTLRFMLLARVAKQEAGAYTLLEQPGDPGTRHPHLADKAPSLMAITQPLQWAEDLGLTRIAFDGCMGGGLVNKDTEIWTDMPLVIRAVGAMGRCNHQKHEPKEAHYTADLARWPHGLQVAVVSQLAAKTQEPTFNRANLTDEQATTLKNGDHVNITHDRNRTQKKRRSITPEPKDSRGDAGDHT